MLTDSYQIVRNEDWRRAYTVQSGGVAVDLAGASLYMHARRRGALDLLAAARVGSGIAIVNAATGQFDLTIPAAALATAEAGDYDFDILMVSTGGAIRRLVAGVVTLSDGVTRL